jgi:hypothetical protein
MAAHLNTIEIEVSDAILAAYAPRLELETWINPENFGLFDDGRFVLTVLPDGYTADPKTISTVSLSVNGACVTVEKPARTIQIETGDCREAIALIFEEIQEEKNYKSFKIYDYHRPNKSDRSQGYTVRNVFLKQVEPMGGTITTDTDWGRVGTAGTRIVFSEIEIPA